MHKCMTLPLTHEHLAEDVFIQNKHSNGINTKIKKIIFFFCKRSLETVRHCKTHKKQTHMSKCTTLKKTAQQRN